MGNFLWRRFRAFGWACFGLAMGLFARPARAESLAEQVNRAIERGIAEVRNHIAEDGSGRTRYHGDYPEGDTALLLLTLVKSGVSADDPQVKAMIAWLHKRAPRKTYSAGVLIMALDALKDPAFDAQIQSAAKWLDESLGREKNHRFSYPGGHQDISNTQYGVLGLWTAERHGYKAAPERWAGLLNGAVDAQNEDDGFAYRDDDISTGSMTVAALAVLELALARAPEDGVGVPTARRRAKDALTRGWSYLERRFTVEGDPHGPHSMREAWFHYYLYGVERLCAITGRDRIGEHDWYTEGARKLVATQRANGSWGDPWDTCFALLFLRKATFTTMNRSVLPVAGDGVTPALPPPAKPRPDVPFVRRWLLLGPVDDPQGELLFEGAFDPAKASPRVYSYSGPDRWNERRSLHDAVDLNGPRAENARERAGVMTCAFTYLHAAIDSDAVLWIGHDNGCRVWLDGKVVHDRPFEDAYGADTFPVRVRLTAGPHRLLAKVRNGGGPHNFLLRVAQPDGAPVRTVRPSLSPDGPEPVADAVAHPSAYELADLLMLLPRERRAKLGFDGEDHLEKFAFDGESWIWPLWSRTPDQRKTGLPNPGAIGVVAIHPADRGRPSQMTWKVKVPTEPSVLAMRVSACTTSAIGRADALLRVAAYDGELKVLGTATVGPDAKPDPDNWKVVEFDLSPYVGEEILLIAAAVNGGPHDWDWETIWIDQVEIRAR